MRLLSWFVVVPAALAVVAFSVSNRADVAVNFWPLPFTSEFRVFAVVLVSIFAGFVLGGLVAWISGGKARRRARREGQRADRAEREIKDVEARLERQQSETESTEPGHDAPRLPPDSPTPPPEGPSEGHQSPQAGVPASTRL